jgi:hypothetical protein
MPRKSPLEPLSTSQQIQKLKLFNEKIEVVRRGRFATLVSRPDHGFTIKFGSGAPMDIEKRGADEESTLALVTTLRFFVQERDGISLRQIAHLYEMLAVEERAKTSARGAANANDEFLDRPCGFGLNVTSHTVDQLVDGYYGAGLNGDSHTNREVFEIFMYGGLAHANAEKKLKYDEWMRGPFAPMMQYVFEDIAATILQRVQSFYAMNERTIALLESTQ